VVGSAAMAWAVVIAAVMARSEAAMVKRRVR
jgi:hypothetical protein